MRAEPRVALCSVGELFGGVERHLLGMCAWQQRHGQTPLLILFHDAELARQARMLGVEPVIVPTRGALDPGVPGRIAAVLAAAEVNVVHAHGYRAVVNCALALRRHHFVLVRTVHGLIEPSSRLGLKWYKSQFYVWLERFWSRRVGAAVTYVTEDLRNRHSAVDHGLRTWTVPNGIDPLGREGRLRPSELESGVFEVLAVGRVSAVKGLPFAFQAMASLPPGANIRLNVLGTGPLEGELKDQVDQMGMADRVRFLGFRANVYDYLAHADALIMPSLHEGAPYTILEAMSLGLPIIASRTGGLQELIVPESTGILVDVGDVAGLAAALLECSSDPEYCRRLGAAARERQAAAYSLDSMGDAFRKLYADVLNQDGK